MLEEVHDAENSSSKNHDKKGGASTQEKAKLRSPAYAYFEQIDPGSTAELSEGSEEMDILVKDFEVLLNGFQEEKIVKGTITEVRDNDVIVDVGFKSEGSIPVSEFRDREELKPGDEVEVFLEKLENQDGLVVLSKEKADFLRVWDEIRNSHDTGKIMKGRVARRIKGGLVVDLLGVDAFLPGSQIALRQVPNLDDLIGEELNFKIIKINRRRRNIVVSRRIVLEEEREEQKKKVLSELIVGQVREGVVKNITDFGAFVDLGGVDGLLHLTDMTWGRISHPSEVVAIGNNLKVKILDFDREREKISLGLKQLTPYPWDGVEERYLMNNKVRGKIVSLTDYGAFVELEKGVEGLIHISEMSWTRHVKHPSKVLAIGEIIDAVVLKVDKENQKISLGLKQMEPDPWSTLEQKYPAGTRITGRIRNLTNFGAFVEIEDGIDGLLHISDMSWAKRVRHPSEIVKKNEKVDVVVLDISQEKKRISLGMKQLTENPWQKLAEEYSVGTTTEGRITRLLDKGAVVDIRDDVEGFVPLGQMGKEGMRHPEEYYSVGDQLPLKVMKIDPKSKRIVLSISLYLKSLNEEEAIAFHQRFPRKTVEAEESKEPVEASEPQSAEAKSPEESKAEELPVTGENEEKDDSTSESTQEGKQESSSEDEFSTEDSEASERPEGEIKN